MLKKKLDQSNLFLLLIVLFSIIKQLINDGCRDKTDDLFAVLKIIIASMYGCLVLS